MRSEIRWVFRAGVVVCLTGVVSCESGGATVQGGQLKDIADYCMTDGECSTGHCLISAIALSNGKGGLCTKSCKADRECATAFDQYSPKVCGTGPDGEGTCAPGCGASNTFVCKAGKPVFCDLADESDCETCGCANGKRCTPGVGCGELGETDAPCQVDADCRSNNCSTFAGVCRVPVGQACTGSNCDRCLSSGGFSFCSKTCTSDEDCNGSYCESAGVDYACMPSCDGPCPGACLLGYSRGPQAPLVHYCGCTNCSVASAPRGLGTACSDDSECASKDCYLRVSCGPRGCTGKGTCSAVCTSDIECGDGVCADVPCVGSPSDPASCGRRCLPRCSDDGTCSVGYCRELATVDSGSLEVCDKHAPASVECAAGTECQSGNCVDGRCAPESGVPNGQTCTQSADCSSGTCINGHCRGDALIGDHCELDADCAAGRCCARATGNVCATTC